MNEHFKHKVEQLIRQGVISSSDGRKLLQQLEGGSGSRVTSPPPSAPTFQAVVLGRPTRPDRLEILPQEDREPQAGEVQILVKAFPINFSDFLLINGLYPMMPEYPFTPGVEVSGIVRKIGPGVTSVQIGDEVIGVMRVECGGQGSLVMTDDNMVVRKPTNLSHEEACGMPAAFLSMYIACEKAQLRCGDKVFIPSAAGTNGLVAVQLAKLAGAEVFATASTAEKLGVLREMGVDHLFNHQDVHVVEEVLRRTGGRGVDVVINTVAGESIQQGLNVLAPEGRYVEIAVFGLQTAGGLNLSRLVDNQTFFSFNVKKFLTYHPDQRRRYLDKMAVMLEQGLVKPRVARLFPFSRLDEAYACKQDRNLVGRVVVSMPSVGHIPVTPVMKLNSPVVVSERLWLETETERESNNRHMDIAVIGMSGRFADAENVHEFWEHLAKGKNSIVEIPLERWDNREHYDPDHRKWDKTSNNWGGFLRQVDQFDAMFFQISGREAEQMDPQQRLFLEESWRALEDAGYALEGGERANCGVFVGVAKGDYLSKMQEHAMPAEAQSFWGNESSILAARISYHLNFQGPAVAIDTACSSSLVAIHMACQSLRAGECDMALAGGVFVYVTPGFIKVASSGGMLSPRGQCRTFDNSADGFVPGEAVGAVLLKPLQLALRDRDQIYGVIKGSKINQDGKTNGITAPSSLAQTEVQTALYREFGIDPRTISYIEAHGTGTKLGDPIEVEALTQSFRQFSEEKGFCAIGSVKTNIGHAAAAAGVTGLIKILQALRHKQLPASLHYEVPNEHIDFANSPFRVHTELRPWEAAGTIRRAAINSFGFSGTNAHLVVEEPPVSPKMVGSIGSSAYLIPLSAKTNTSLAALRTRLADWVERFGDQIDLDDLAYTLQERRSHFTERFATVVSTPEELVISLRNKDELNQSACNDVLFSTELNTQSKQLLQELTHASGHLLQEVELLNKLAELYVAGCEIAWNALVRPPGCRVVTLPSYPFDGERYWVPEKKGTTRRETLQLKQYLHPLIERNTSTLYEQRYTTTLHSEDFYLADHQVQTDKIFPGVCYLEWARAAGELAAERRVSGLRQVRWLKPIIVEDRLEVHIRFILMEEGLEFEVYTSANTGREVHCKGQLLLESEVKCEQKVTQASLTYESWNESMFEKKNLRADDVYALFSKCGFFYGPSFRSVRDMQVRDDSSEVRTLLELPDVVKGDASSFYLHPSLLDGALQSVIAFVDQERLEDGDVFLPVGFEELTMVRAVTSPAFARIVPTYIGDGEKRFDLQVYNQDDELALHIRGFTIRLRKHSQEDALLLRMLFELERGERDLKEVELALEG